MTSEACSIEKARALCRELAQTHYENFFVASFLLPRKLRQHFYNVYAYCRLSDNLADNSVDPQAALTSLKNWEQELQICYQGRPRLAVFLALQETISTYNIPKEPFLDLLKAFKIDQVKTRYKTYGDLLEYCQYSANPVGRLVLYLGGYSDSERQELSDLICTALQLTNHWQDINWDFEQLKRIYIPLDDMEKFQYYESDLGSRICDKRFIELMKMEIKRTQNLFKKGLPLCSMLDGSLGAEVELIVRSGQEILRRIELVQYDIFRCRPTLSKRTGLKLLIQCFWSKILTEKLPLILGC